MLALLPVVVAALLQARAAPPVTESALPAVASAASSRVPSPVELARSIPPQDDERSAWYYRRLKVHRLSSYAMLPLFAVQYAAGAELYENGGEGADWAEAWHGVGAAAIAGLFAVNVATGVPNLVEIWHEPRDRRRRLFHASAMLIAAAGFTATGIIADEAEGSPSRRSLHRTVALSSMGVATIGYLSMLDLFRRD